MEKWTEDAFSGVVFLGKLEFLSYGCQMQRHLQNLRMQLSGLYLVIPSSRFSESSYAHIKHGITCLTRYTRCEKHTIPWFSLLTLEYIIPVIFVFKRETRAQPNSLSTD